MTFEPDLCACAPPLLRRCLAVENLHGAGQRVMACLRCGASAAVRDRVEDIPYDDYGRVRVVGVDAVPLSASADNGSPGERVIHGNRSAASLTPRFVSQLGSIYPPATMCAVYAWLQLGFSVPHQFSLTGTLSGFKSST